jgi:hypothetical protein
VSRWNASSDRDYQPDVDTRLWALCDCCKDVVVLDPRDPDVYPVRCDACQAKLRAVPVELQEPVEEPPF